MGNAQEHAVFIVGAATQERAGLRARLTRSGISAQYFRSAGPCRRALEARPCRLIVVDLDGDIADGLHLLGDSQPAVSRIPKLALVHHGDIPTAIQAIKAGAVNCLERPLNIQELLGEIKRLSSQADQEDRSSRSVLTRMETSVLHLILEGRTNGETAKALCRSPRTVEVHRKNIMRKLRASSIVDLVKTAFVMGLFEALHDESPWPAGAGPELCGEA